MAFGLLRPVVLFRATARDLPPAARAGESPLGSDAVSEPAIEADGRVAEPDLCVE